MRGRLLAMLRFLISNMIRNHRRVHGPYLMYAKVSVLLPVRNAASTLGEAVESLLRQTLQDLEIIAVEDGSDDESLAILRGLAETDNRLQVFDQKAQGIVMALNFAAQQATAPLLARMDADDICEPERLALQLAVMEREPDLAALGSSVVGFGQVGEGWQRYLDWLNGLKDSEAVHRNLYVESPLAHPSVMMRRTAFEGVGGYREFDGPEDYDLWLRLGEAGAPVALARSWGTSDPKERSLSQGCLPAAQGRASEPGSACCRGSPVDHLGSGSLRQVGGARPAGVGGENHGLFGYRSPKDRPPTSGCRYSRSRGFGRFRKSVDFGGCAGLGGTGRNSSASQRLGLPRRRRLLGGCVNKLGSASNPLSAANRQK